MPRAFEADRTFSVQNQKTGLVEWYFQAREGNAGPFTTKARATEKLNEFKALCIKTNDAGGRHAEGHLAMLSGSVSFELTDRIAWY